jgi:Double-GTPase 2
MANKGFVCPRCLQFFYLPYRRNAQGQYQQVAVQRRGTWDRMADALRTEAPAPGPSAQARAAYDDATSMTAVCPSGHRLPPDYLERPTIVVGLVGLTGASKSTYLTVLIDQLYAGALAPLDISVEMDELSADRFEAQYRQLLVDHRQLPLTPPLLEEGQSPEPFMLVLRRATRGAPERSVNVVFFDASGEQLYRKEDLGRFGKFLYVAGAVIVVLSPGIFPGLRAVADPGEAAIGPSRPLQMLVNLADLLRAARGLRRDAWLDGISASVILSKADKLCARPDFPAETLRNPDVTVASLPRLFEEVRSSSARLVDFLEGNGGSNRLTALLGRLPDPTVHAVSATGSDPANGQYPRIAPVGVLEPLLVLLARHRFIPSDGLELEAAVEPSLAERWT